jgi:hypothetical protein
LGPEQIQAFFDKWVEQLPMPLTAADRQAGYRHRLSIWQLEVSRTQVFADAHRGREFFEAVIRENLAQGRPDRVQLVFDRKIIKSTPGQFRTRVIEDGVQPSLHIEYKTSRVKQYFKENRALRTERRSTIPRIRREQGPSQLPTYSRSGARSIDVSWTSNGSATTAISPHRTWSASSCPPSALTVNVRPACALAKPASWRCWRHSPPLFRRRKALRTVPYGRMWRTSWR